MKFSVYTKTYARVSLAQHEFVTKKYELILKYVRLKIKRIFIKYVLAQLPKQHCSRTSLELSFHFSKKEFGHAYLSILK